MAAAKYFLIGSVAVFSVVGALGYLKKKDANKPEELSKVTTIVEEIPIPESFQTKTITPAFKEPEKTPLKLDETPVVDRVKQLFALDSSKLPIVETISYTSRVPWIEGRPAWISDYASHYETSRHFIARSLNKKVDYFSQKVGPGDRFNVFKKDKDIRFHLLIDLSKSQMCFYAIDKGQNERYFLKTYRVGLGRSEPLRKSGYLTPIGKYELGDKIAIYKPGTMGFFQDEKTEMIRVFGTRWIPFSKEIEGCSEDAKGYGIHGAPWVEDPLTGELVEDASKIGQYDSDGCIRLSKDDMEELFAIIITKPTTVEIVHTLEDTTLPGVQK